MTFSEELLQQAFELLSKDATKLKQADLRRSVSSAYYALFHLLISETILHWDLESSRDALGRMFEHSVMKRVSHRTSDPRLSPFKGEDALVVGKLRLVAAAFVFLQEMRKLADYDNSKQWSYQEALDEAQRASDTFSNWKSIRQEKIAQTYLVSLLINSRD